ncbi:MAG TPA: glycosyltransferase [Verrucomicrobiae bacterium]|jgi:glycosyltransferase involved in cell wall biosynthesis|nr:glycosyltransferase [Verrucomicrobiae bacterium]
MRILIVSPYLPWPLNSGGNAAQFSTLKCLEEDHQFTLVCPVYSEAGVARAKELQAQLPRVKLQAVFCGESGAKPNPLIQKAGRVVQFGRRLLNSPEKESPWPDVPYYPFSPLPEKFVEAVNAEVAKGVDVCQAEFAEMLPLGGWFPKEIPKLFIVHQIHFIYAQRFAEAHGNSSYSDYLKAIMKVEELAYLQGFNGVVTFSELDRQVLLPWLGPERLFTSPFPIPADVGIARHLPPSFDGRFLFVASEENAPNRDALEWASARIWPKILQMLPEAKLVVVGRWSEKARARFAVRGLKFTGFVKDLSALLRGGIMLVPLRIGSGIRVKILVALAQGVPVVSTSVGGEGLLLADGKELLVRDGEAEFATAAAQLSQNPDMWRRLTVAGRAAVSAHYSAEGVRQRRNEIYEILAGAQRNLLPTQHSPSEIAHA